MGQLGHLSPQASIVVGIFVGLLSTSIQSLGLTLQRKSHLLEDEKDGYDEVRRPPYRRRRWQLGMGMFIFSNIVGSTIQITTLPLPVLSTLQASGLVFNTAFATILLKEPFTRFSLIGTILTCTGAALIATFGAIGEKAHGLSQLIVLLARKPFLIWMVATLIVAVATLLLAHILKRRSKAVHESHLDSKLERSPTASRSKGRRRSFSSSLPYPVQRGVSRLRLLRGLSYALISGILSAHSLLVAKSAVELVVRTTVDHVNQFNAYQSWLILLALVIFALTQLYYLHLGLRLCSTSVLYPFVFCVYNIIAILDGLIYFHHTSLLSALHAGLIALGTVILLSGVIALSWRLTDLASNEAPASTLKPKLRLVTSFPEEHGDSQSASLLPTARPRSSASKRVASSLLDESTPLLLQRRRQAGLICPPPPETSQPQQIWAELDDSDDATDNMDFLASLPPSQPSLKSGPALKPRRRSRGEGQSPITSPRSSVGGSGFWPRSLNMSKRSVTVGGEPSSTSRVHDRAIQPSRTQAEYSQRRGRNERVVSATAAIPTGGSRSSSATSNHRVSRDVAVNRRSLERRQLSR